VDAATFWKFLHIACMFLAVSIFVGQGMLSGTVARSGDVRALRRVLAAEDRFAPIGVASSCSASCSGSSRPSSATST
jgi:hypothetical protein